MVTYWLKMDAISSPMHTLQIIFPETLTIDMAAAKKF